MLIKTLFILIGFFLIQTISVKMAQTAVPPSYSNNELVVTFKKGNNPTAIKLQVADRQKRQQSLLRQMVFFWQNMTIKLLKQNFPEEKLDRIKLMIIRTGTIKQQQLNENTFLFTTNATMSLNEVIKAYEILPEVEYAEPNYKYETL